MRLRYEANYNVQLSSIEQNLMFFNNAMFLPSCNDRFSVDSYCGILYRFPQPLESRSWSTTSELMDVYSEIKGRGTSMSKNNYRC